MDDKSVERLWVAPSWKIIHGKHGRVGSAAPLWLEGCCWGRLGRISAGFVLQQADGDGEKLRERTWKSLLAEGTQFILAQAVPCPAPVGIPIPIPLLDLQDVCAGCAASIQGFPRGRNCSPGASPALTQCEPHWVSRSENLQTEQPLRKY